MPAISELPTGKIDALTVFDVKSFAGRHVEAGILTEHGLQDINGRQDHRFVVVAAKPMDSEGTLFHYLRQNHLRSKDRPQGMAAMALVQPSVESGKLTLKWKGEGKQDSIEIDSLPREKTPITIQFNRNEDRARGFRLSKIASDFLSEKLNHEVALVEIDPADLRHVPTEYFPSSATIYNQDAYPYNVGLQESAKRVEEIAQMTIPGIEIPLANYRPQISLSGMPDKSEHVIFTADIVSKKNKSHVATLVHVKPGVRCTITGILYDKGLVLPQNQPLKSLGDERAWVSADGSLEFIFAENAVLLGGEGAQISVGDEYFPTSYKIPRVKMGSLAEMRRIQQQIKPHIRESAQEIAYLVQSL